MSLSDEEWERLFILYDKLHFVVFGEGQRLTPEETTEYICLMKKLFTLPVNCPENK